MRVAKHLIDPELSVVPRLRALLGELKHTDENKPKKKPPIAVGDHPDHLVVEPPQGAL